MLFALISVQIVAGCIFQSWINMAHTETISDWDLNSEGYDSNLAKTLSETWTHMAGTWTQPKLVDFQLRSQTWFQDLISDLKFRFLMSHNRKNSLKDKVIGKNLILFREEHTPQIQCEPS